MNENNLDKINILIKEKILSYFLLRFQTFRPVELAKTSSSECAKTIGIPYVSDTFSKESTSSERTTENHCTY